MRFASLKIYVPALAFALSLCGCGKELPEFPEVYQCQVNGSPRAFYCVNVKTKERVKLAIDDPSMKGAQCLSADDYKASERWVADVKQIAQEHCK